VGVARSSPASHDRSKRHDDTGSRASPHAGEPARLARYGVARALRALGRPLEAVPLLEQAVRWVEETGFEQPEAREYQKELAAAYDEVGRPVEAAALRAALARSSN